MDDFPGGCLLAFFFLFIFTPFGWIAIYVLGCILDALVFNGQLRDYFQTLG